jgi:hypothetical protein
MLRVFVLFVFLVAVVSLRGQSVVGTIPLDDKQVTDIRGMEVGDSIFVSFTYSILSNVLYKYGEESYWVRDSRTLNRVDIPEMTGHALAAVTSQGNYYFFGANKRSSFLRCIKIDPVTGEKFVLSDTLAIPGRILASLVDKDLHLMCVEKDNYVVKLVTIRDMSVIAEKQFSLSFPVFESNAQYVPFIDTDRSPRIEDFTHKTKIIKNGEAVFIVSDDRGDGKEIEKRIFKTNVCRLDLENGKVSNTAFYCDNWNFNSTVAGHHLIRSVGARKIQFYNLNDKKLEYEMSWATEKRKEGYLYYMRFGKNGVVRTDLKKSVASGHLVGVMSQSDGSYRLIIGSSYMPSVTLPLPMLPIALVITPAMHIPLKSIVEKEYLSTYTYYYGSVLNGFTINPTPTVVRREIDDFEIAQIQKGIRYEKKAYLQIKDGVMAVYKERGANELKFVKFKTPESTPVE